MGERRPKRGWLARLSPLWLAIGLAGIAYLVHRLGPAAIWHGLTQVGWGFALVCAIHLGTLMFDAAMLRRCAVATGTRPRRRLLVRVALAGHAINEATPLNQLGELVKYNLLREELPATGAAAALVLQNLLRFAVNAAILAVLPLTAALALGVGPPLTTLLVVTAVGFTVAGAGAVLLLVLGTGDWPFRVLGRLGVGKRRVAHLRARWKRVEDAWQRGAGDRARVVPAAALSLASKACGVLEVALILHLLGQPSPLAVALLVQPAMLAFNSMMSFIPMQIGASEGGAYVLFGAAGLAPELGAIMELVRRVRRLTFVATGVSFFAFKSYRRLLEARAAEAEAEAEAEAPAGP